MNWTANNIRNLRHTLGWSQAEMARQLGCISELVLAWESGAQAPSSECSLKLEELSHQANQWLEDTMHAPQIENLFQKSSTLQFSKSEVISEFEKKP